MRLRQPLPPATVLSRWGEQPVWPSTVTRKKWRWRHGLPPVYIEDTRGSCGSCGLFTWYPGGAAGVETFFSTAENTRGLSRAMALFRPKWLTCVTAVGLIVLVICGACTVQLLCVVVFRAQDAPTKDVPAGIYASPRPGDAWRRPHEFRYGSPSRIARKLLNVPNFDVSNQQVAFLNPHKSFGPVLTGFHRSTCFVT